MRRDLDITRTERRRSRRAPQARLRPGWEGCAPELRPGIWYSLHTTQPPQPFYVWLQTPWGAVAWQRDDLELRDRPFELVNSPGHGAGMNGAG